jgi:hypothetical protein
MIAAINVATRLQGFLSENILCAAKPHQIKISNARKLSHAATSGRNARQKKKPGVAGLS